MIIDRKQKEREALINYKEHSLEDSINKTQEPVSSYMVDSNQKVKKKVM